MKASLQDFDDDDDFVLLEAEHVPLRLKPPHDTLSKETISLDLQNISTHPNELLVSIGPPPMPQSGLKHTPCDIVLVIDVSASMNTAADLPDAGKFDTKESTGWSILDLVKHACRTVLEHLNEQDRLAVVTFSTDAKVVQGLLHMTDSEKKETSSRIEALTVQDSTNLWAGIREGLDLFTNSSSIGNAQGMYVLTDGVPNHFNPAQGFCKKLAPMLQELENIKGQAPIVSVFGFGYYLKSSLLRSIAEVGRGSYSFIPDAGMIGTVFVHAVANLFSTCATSVELTLECSNPSTTIESPPYLEFNTEVQLNTTKLRLGNIQYGQSRDIIIRLNDTLSTDLLKATLRYQLPHGTRNTLAVTHNFHQQCTIPQITIDYHLSRHELCAFLTSLATKSHNDEHIALHAGVIAKKQNALEQLISTIEARVYASPPSATHTTDLIALLADLKSSDESSTLHGHGQISLALQTSVPAPEPSVHDLTPQTSISSSSPSRTLSPLSNRSPVCMVGPRALPFYTRWGQHYLPSILHAHAYQVAMTFKDRGPLRYGKDSQLFVKCRNDLDDAFDRLPTPKPSLKRACSGVGIDAAGGTRQNGYVQMQMSRFNRVDNPCFSGSCLVRCADGTCDLRVDEIRVGDILWTAAGGRMVRGIVVTRVENQEMIGVDGSAFTSAPSGTEASKLWITPWHPVSIGGQWMFPEELQGTKRKVIIDEEVYSFIMEKDEDDKAHTVEVEGIVCTTLGHGLTRKRMDGEGGDTDDFRVHPFFGDYDAVMGNLEQLEKDDCGRMISGGIAKWDSDDGSAGALAYGFIGPDEAERVRLGNHVAGLRARL